MFHDVEKLYISGVRSEEAVVAKLSLTNADIQNTLSLATPIDLVAAPGTSYRHIVHWVGLYAFINTAYQNVTSDGRMRIIYENGEDASGPLLNDVATSQTGMADLFGTAGSWVARLPGKFGALETGEWGLVAQVLAASEVVNNKIQLAMEYSGGSFTFGHFSNTLTVRCCYSTVKVT